ncbi:AAA family ATPase [Acidisphaera sp. S103]|uniref:AAA family ATPase n=1 Tax=Acidisphaera sp. S103 TaxID=1747223 RepID=UPI00131BC3EE|nr:AAA family ATPase [Acidisphaera sp. S103]
MRLTCLHLFRYGSFEDEHVRFDPRKGVLNLVLAPNGGGKSVLRSAFCDLLFGIAGQSPMGFRYGYPNMRIAAEALSHDDQAFTFGRRKGHGNTLVDADGSALDPATVMRFLGRTDRVRLERLFALDTDRLRQGEADLLASDGDLGQALASGAGEIRDLPAIRKRLQETRDGLAPRRRVAGRPFYVGLDQYVEARRRKDQSLLKPEQWEKLRRDRDAQEERQVEYNRNAGLASAEIAMLERVRRVRPLLAVIDSAAQWLRENSDAPVIDPGLAARLSAAREQVAIAEDRAQRHQEAAGRLTEQLAGVLVDEGVLAEADEIDRLATDSGAARKSQADLPSVKAQADAAATAIEGFLRELGRDLPVQRAAEAVPPRAAINRVRRLINDYQTRKRDEQPGPATIQERTRERDKAREQLEALLAPGDLSGLEALVKEVRADGDPVRKANDAAGQAATDKVALTTAMAKVPGWSGDAIALAALAPLPIEAYERQAALTEQACSAAATHHATLHTLEAEREAAQKVLNRLVGPAPLPDEAALSRARAYRDEGWQLIYRRAFTADPPTSQEERAFAKSLALPLAYERAVTDADDFADRRVHETTLVERAHAAQAKLAEAETKLQKAADQYQSSKESSAAADAAWIQLCAIFPLGPAPGLGDVRQFLKAREDAIDARHTVLKAEAASAALKASHSVWAAHLAELLEVAGQPGLPDLLMAADRKLAQARQVETTRAALESQQKRAEADLADAERAHQQAIQALATWQAEWARATTDLGRPVAEDPAVMDDVLQVFSELDGKQKEHASAAVRVEGMERDIERFARDAAAMAARVPGGSESTDPFLIVTTLQRRAQEERQVQTRRDSLSQQAQETAKQCELAEQQLADRKSALRAILLLIGAETVEAAEVRLALAAERARQTAALASAEEKLLEAGDSYSLEALRQEVGAVLVEDLPARLDDARQRLGHAQQAAQEAAAAVARLAMEMQQAEIATGATDAAADQQAAVATMGRTLEEALVCHVAAELLEQAIASAAQDAEPEMLRRISARFSSLTNGEYTRVLTEETDQNQTRLSLVQRDFPGERQLIRELSEGTRDQLYLALRLAAIEDYADAPLPFIGDDILQTFDDARALAALRVLQDVSHSVQVILLTHHRHLLDLAAALPAGSVHKHYLGVAEEVV